MKIYDLTHELNAKMSLFPGASLYNIDQTAAIKSDMYNEHKITITTHLGTHMDSPNHILTEGKRLCDYPVSQFIGNGLVVDVSQVEVITREFLNSNEKINKAEFILFYTGHAKFYGTEEYLKPFASLDEEGALYIAELGKGLLKGIGVDSFSIDPIEPLSIDNHKIILGADLLIIENLKDLDLLLNETFIFETLPMRFEKIEGCPVRAIAIVLT